MNSVIQENFTELHLKLGEMAKLVVTAIDQSVDALKDKDIEKAKQIRRKDKLINKIRWDIEERCITLIATQQPVASDLREVISLLYIITELERIGDYAAGIAKITVLIGDEEHVKPLIDIPRMRDIAIDMIENTMKAYITQSEKSARMIHSQDDDIDALYKQVYRELISFMIEKPANITQCTHLLWVAHNLERMGDRVTNICERIIYLSTGERADDL
ncbi:MAG: phosphate transport system regulatory protein PhoU [Balneolaceae bacterium]|nr:MAG: phosphate transport system regulatory protein PhoU [Balneolaceae bacterium]